MITYKNSAIAITTTQLAGFFVGWPNPPSPQTHLALLNQSAYRILALDEETSRVIGFITAISDGILSAYIPLLEVLPNYQGQGIGQELVRQMLAELKGFYMIDLLCDPTLQPFYSRVGLEKSVGMFARNYDRQAGFV